MDKLDQEENLIKNKLLLFEKNSGNLMPSLQQIQKTLGYIPPKAIELIATYFSLPMAKVYEVITFYAQFRLNPPGQNQIKVCMGTACHMRGASILMDNWERKLKIKAGQTTKDGLYSLERVACVGCCNLAPVMLNNEEIIPNATPIKIEGMLFSYELGENNKKED